MKPCVWVRNYILINNISSETKDKKKGTDPEKTGPARKCIFIEDKKNIYGPALFLDLKKSNISHD